MNLTPQSRSALAPISPPLFFFSGKGLFISVLRLDSWASFMFSRSKESGLLLLASLVTSSENGASPWSHNRKQLVRPFQFIIFTNIIIFIHKPGLIRLNPKLQVLASSLALNSS